MQWRMTPNTSLNRTARRRTLHRVASDCKEYGWRRRLGWPPPLRAAHNSVYKIGGMRRKGGFMRWSTIALVGLATAFSCQAAHFQNGSFEIATVDPGGAFVTLPSGDTEITGWTVVSGDIDYIGGFWVASNGGRSLDLFGDQNVGGIQQTFDTITGGTYQVTFDLAGNSGGPPTVKPLQVTVGSTVQNFTFDTTGKSPSAMGWVSQQVTFTATGTKYTFHATHSEAGTYGANGGKTRTVSDTGNVIDGTYSIQPDGSLVTKNETGSGVWKRTS